jgi:hypothetical protein
VRGKKILQVSRTHAEKNNKIKQNVVVFIKTARVGSRWSSEMVGAASLPKNMSVALRGVV